MNDPELETRRTEAEALSLLFEQRTKLSQAEFGRKYEIGNQSMVSQYLLGRSPLNLEAASKFAHGLQVEIKAFSPRLDDYAQALFTRLGGPEYQITTVEPKRNVGELVVEIAEAMQTLPDGTRMATSELIRLALKDPDSARLLSSQIELLLKAGKN